MVVEYDPILVRRLRIFSLWAALLTVGTGATVLVAWTLNATPVTSVLSGLSTMKPVTAAALLLAGLGLLVLHEEADQRSRRKSAVAACLALLSLLMAVDSLLENFGWWAPGISRWLFQIFAWAAPESTATMAANTAIGILILDLAVLSLDYRTRGNYSPAQVLALIPAGLAYASLLAYVLSPVIFDRTISYSGTALHTALAIGLLSAGVLAARPQRAGWVGLAVSNTPGGFLVRRFLPIMLIMPLPVSWLRLKGQQLEWYRKDFGFIVPALATVVLLFAFMLWASRSLNRVAAAREAAMRALQASQQSLQHLADRLQSLHTVDLDILAARTPQEIADATLKRVATLIPCDRASLVLFPARDDHAHFLSVWEGEPLGPPAGTRVPLLNFSPVETLRRERYVTDLSTSIGSSLLLEKMHNRGLRSALSMPIVLADELIGELNFSSVKPAAFQEEDIQVAREVATQLAVALHNARIHEELRASEANFRSLFENSPLGIYRSSLEGKFLDVNPALMKTLGYSSPSELLAKDLTQDIYADPEQRRRMMTAPDVADAFQGYQVQWKRRDGALIHVSLSGRPILDRSGKVEAFEVIAEDVSQQRSLEEQLRQSQKMEAVGQLTAGIAHDFNNVLGIILGYSEVLQAKCGERDPASHGLQEIEKAARRAAAMTRQLLAFSRQQVLEIRPLDLNRIINDMEPMLRRLLGENIDLITELMEGLGTVKADPGQVEQVLLNLSINARDAMLGGGRLIVETADTELDEHYTSRHYPAVPGRYVMIAVSDTGTGMDERTRTHIFEPFFTTKEAGKGTGLGLATVYGIVKQSGGFIWVYSELGRGTTFKILLPRVEESPPASAIARPSNDSARGSETILIVEDAEALRLLTRYLLEDRGYSILEAGTPEHALKIIRQHSGEIHLLVTDVVMPGMTGPELMAEVAKLRHGIKVLYISGYPGSAIAHHGVPERGAFLQKPYSNEILTRKVRDILDAAIPVK